MANREHRLKGPSNGVYSPGEVESIEFAISEIEDKTDFGVVLHKVNLEAVLGKVKKANEWDAVIQGYEN